MIIKRAAVILLCLVLVPFFVLYVWSSGIIHKKYKIPLTEIAVPTDSVEVAEGKRLASIAHCGGCHGSDFTGRVVVRIKNEFKFVAPNITKIIPEYTASELERLLKHGIKKNGESVYFMPCFSFHELKDESVARIIAYLKTIAPAPSYPDLPSSIVFYPLGRLHIIQGKLPHMADIIDHDSKDKYVPRDSSQVALGQYIAMSTCTSCHGLDLKGEQGFSPDLVIATAYTPDQFMHLIKTGEGGLGRKKLRLMSETAKNFLSALREEEINAVYAYLRSMHTKQP